MEDDNPPSALLPPSITQADVKGWERRAEPETVEKAGPLEVLHAGDGLLVVNKPPDVRMQGDFTVTVETLVKHWCAHLLPPEPTLKYIHQLDYATSGVLALGYEKKAAAAASSLFENRLTSKYYIAVVYGHVDPSRFPIYDDHQASSPPATKAIGRKVALSYRPGHAFFQEYQRELGRRDPASLTDEERSLLSVPWSATKGRADLRARFEAMATADRERALAEVKRKEEEDAEARVAWEVHCQPGEPPDRFVIDAPLCEVAGDFRMQVGRGPGWKPAKTYARVVGHGRFRGQEVTKLELKPISGRRHQLRLHMVRAGHPIVGDATYANDTEAPRMMLHALRLTLPFPPDQGPGRTLDLLSQDPFPLEDGLLVVTPSGDENDKAAKTGGESPAGK